MQAQLHAEIGQLLESFGQRKKQELATVFTALRDQVSSGSTSLENLSLGLEDRVQYVQLTIKVRPVLLQSAALHAHRLLCSPALSLV